MATKNNIPDFEAMGNTLKKDAVRYAARTGVTFFQDSFYNQGFTDAVFEPWAKRKGDIDPGRKILVKSASLLNSIAVFSKSNKRIVFGSDEAHAQIHNEGGTIRIPVTERSRKYFWYMYKATEKSMWKSLALTKKTELTVHIPQRQFIGHSETLMGQLDDWLINYIETKFKAL